MTLSSRGSRAAGPKRAWPHARANAVLRVACPMSGVASLNQQQVHSTIASAQVYYRLVWMEPPCEMNAKKANKSILVRRASAPIARARTTTTKTVKKRKGGKTMVDESALGFTGVISCSGWNQVAAFLANIGGTVLLPYLPSRMSDMCFLHFLCNDQANTSSVQEGILSISGRGWAEWSGFDGPSCC